MCSITEFLCSNTNEEKPEDVVVIVHFRLQITSLPLVKNNSIDYFDLLNEKQ
jgi:hypothetical protein